LSKIAENYVWPKNRLLRYTTKIGCLRIKTAIIRENHFLQNPIFAVKFVQNIFATSSTASPWVTGFESRLCAKSNFLRNFSPYTAKITFPPPLFVCQAWHPRAVDFLIDLEYEVFSFSDVKCHTFLCDTILSVFCCLQKAILFTECNFLLHKVPNCDFPCTTPWTRASSRLPLPRCTTSDRP
jgi:hypothetical protein